MKRSIHWAMSLLLLVTCAAAAEPPKGSDGVAGGPVIETFDVYGRSMLSAMMALVDQTLAEEKRILKVLADMPVVRAGQWEKMRDVLQAAQPANALGIVWFVRPDGSYYTMEQGLTKENLSDRPYFAGLMDGKVVSGSLVVSKTSRKKSVVVAVPVREAGKVVGALGMSIFLERFSERVTAALSLPPSMVFYCLSPEGMVILHRYPQYIFEDPAKLGSETLRVAETEMLAKNAVEVTYDFAGYKRRVLCQASPTTQWRFAIGINTAAIAVK